jgi:aspartyl-tRNA(Asn)/glutamyl-tRNA(Gln) amidotransferase subunit C
MSLTRKQVEYIAELAKLELTDEEIVRYTGQLSAVLDYASELQKIPTDAIAPTASVLPISTVMREDVVQPSLPRDQAVANAPDAIEGQFRVDAVLDTE